MLLVMSLFILIVFVLQSILSCNCLSYLYYLFNILFYFLPLCAVFISSIVPGQRKGFIDYCVLGKQWLCAVNSVPNGIMRAHTTFLHALFFMHCNHVGEHITTNLAAFSKVWSVKTRSCTRHRQSLFFQCQCIPRPR